MHLIDQASGPDRDVEDANSRSGGVPVLGLGGRHEALTQWELGQLGIMQTRMTRRVARWSLRGA